MEAINEIIPFFVGLLVIPLVLMRTLQSNWSETFKQLTSLIIALLTGATISLFMGELARDLPEAIASIIIDTSLVYTGSQIMYGLFWKPFLAMRSRKTNIIR
jgi:hypothetical protein